MSHQNQSIYFHSISQPSLWEAKEKKTFLSGDLCVLCNVMPWNISFPWMGFSSVLWVAPKKNVLSPIMLATFGKHFSNFPISIKRQQFYFSGQRLYGARRTEFSIILDYYENWGFCSSFIHFFTTATNIYPLCT